jgi:hypothetical protein
LAGEATDRDFVLLGIKYEAAKVGGVDETSLANIECQIQGEVGEGWETNPIVLRGRNAVRVEHGLERLDEPSHRNPTPSRTRRPFLNKLLRR